MAVRAVGVLARANLLEDRHVIVGRQVAANGGDVVDLGPSVRLVFLGKDLKVAELEG